MAAISLRFRDVEVKEKLYRVFFLLPVLLLMVIHDELFYFRLQGRVPGPLPGLDGAGPDRVREGAPPLHAPPSTRVRREAHFSHLTGRVADPDPNWIRIQLGQWVRIQEGKNDPQK